MNRALAIIALAAVLGTGRAPAALHGQAGQEALTFDVASVKPNVSGDPNPRLSMTAGQYAWTNTTLRTLIGTVYQRSGFDNRKVIGGPGWIDSERFDVVGRSERPPTDANGFPEPVFAMVRALLTERFKLAVHTESRDSPIYALVLNRRDGRLGPKLRRTDIDCVEVNRGIAQGRRPELTPEGLLPCAVRRIPGHLTANGITMPQLANVVAGAVPGLGAPVERPAVDRTGLDGYFFVDLEFTELNASPGGAADRPADAGPSVFTALQEQLGLRLDATRGAIDVLVIDRVERPTPD